MSALYHSAATTLFSALDRSSAATLLSALMSVFTSSSLLPPIKDLNKKLEQDEVYVTYATNDQMAIGVLVLGNSLRDTQTTRKLVVIMTSDLNPVWA